MCISSTCSSRSGLAGVSHAAMLPDRIRTARLLLRKFRFVDADDIFAYAWDAEFARYLDPKPADTRDAPPSAGWRRPSCSTDLASRTPPSSATARWLAARSLVRPQLVRRGAVMNDFLCQIHDEPPLWGRFARDASTEAQPIGTEPACRCRFRARETHHGASGTWPCHCGLQPVGNGRHHWARRSARRSLPILRVVRGDCPRPRASERARPAHGYYVKTPR